LLELPAHRDRFIAEAEIQAVSLMRDVAEQCRDAAAQLAEAEARVNAALSARRLVIQRAVAISPQLDAARTQLNALVNERRRPRPSAAAIPQTRTPASSSDPEANRLKLSGNRVVHTEAIHGAEEKIEHADQEIRVAAATLRKCEADLETTAAAYAREADSVQRQHGESGKELTGLRRQLLDLDARIVQAREHLGSDPARQAMVSDRAWARAVERHVEPDHTALRARARITGYAGVYASQADLGRAVADIHAHLAQQPDFQALLNARTADEFERAATQLPDGVIDRVHDHGRPVGHGFSNHPDQTARPAELTRSCYSLQFVQGRVLVSHIYPQVPPRQLQATP
jgi:chromosome segregation ATPase